jgi:hypothetical protein
VTGKTLRKPHAGLTAGTVEDSGGEGGSESSEAVANYRKREDTLLRAAGFEAGQGDLWKRGSTWFCRKAALQYARRELL